ncbi:MAG TPA: ABC transporter substrate-binding protein [Gaiellaceae bacterium]|nr:ABC transporter substrate-binding protein [Gaiellaceae bacterium]
MVRFASRRLTLALAAATALTATVVTAAWASSASHASASRSKGLTTVRVVFDWPGIDFEAVPLTVGTARGLYKKAGLDVRIVIPPSTSTTVQMIAAGKGDIGFDTTTDVVFGQAAGIDVRSIANYSQDNNWGLVAKPGAKIDIKKIKGKSIGIFTDSWTKAMMPYVLKAGGVTASQVKQPIFSSDDIAPLLAGKIDLATNTLNYAIAQVQSATGKRPSVLLATKFGAPNVPVWVYTGMNSWLKGHGAQARAFLSATRKAFAWSIAHPSAAVKDYLEAYPKIGGGLKYSLDGWKATIPALGAQSSLLTQRASQWKQVVHALKAVGVLSKSFAPSKYFTNAYLKG